MQKDFGNVDKFEVVPDKSELPFHLELVQAMFAILVVMPMRKEVKLELKTLEKTLTVYQRNLGLQRVSEPAWFCDESSSAKDRVLALKYLLHQIQDPIIEQLALHCLMFVLFGTFIRSKQYNGMERTLIKFFLESTQDLIRDIMLLGKHVKIFFYLTIFESEFGEGIPQDFFNLKQMGKLFSENIRALKLEKSLERSQTL